MTDSSISNDAQFPENGNVALVQSQQSVFTAEECARITGLRDKLPMMAGQLGTDEKIEQQNRDSEIRWVDLDENTGWIYERIHSLTNSVNQLYRFNLTGLRERFQLADYTRDGHFTWHSDLGVDSRSTRKLSISVQLSDSSDYDGGDLQFLDIADAQPRALGSVIVFPSYLVHRVTPVTHGMRSSLVAWIHGPSFS